MANIFTDIIKRITGPGNMPAPKPMREMGVSGTAVYGGGYIATVERSAKWTGRERYRTASDIVINVSIVAAGVHHFLNLLAHPNWSVKPTDDNNKQSVELAEFTEKVLNEMTTPWSRVVRRAGMYRFHGFGIQEWIAIKREDGKIGFRDIEPRPQHTIERWEVDEDGTVQGMWQRSPQTFELLGLPRSKVLYLVEDTLTDSPEGLGIFRHLLEPYERLKEYIDLETRAFERDLRGIPIGRAPITLINRAVNENKLSAAEGAALITGMREFIQTELKKSNTAIMLDSMPYESQTVAGINATGGPQWGIELLQGSGNGLVELASAIDRIQREMARIIGTEHLMMGDKGGNRALSVDKSRNLYLIANSVISNIAAGVKTDLIEPLWNLNGFPKELMPTISVEDVAFKDVAEVTAAIRDMATAGAVLAPDDPIINDIRDLLGVSRAPNPTPEEIAAAHKPPPDPLALATAQAEAKAKATTAANATVPGKVPGSGKKPATEDAANQAIADAAAKKRLEDRFVEDGAGLVVKPKPNGHDPESPFLHDPGAERFIETGEGLIIHRAEDQ